MAINYYDQYFKGQDPEKIKALMAERNPGLFDVAVSDNTVTMNGRPESLPSQVGDEPIPLDLESANVAPTAPEPVTPPIMPPKPQIEAPKKAIEAPKAPSAGSNPLEALLQASSTDQDARNRMLKDEKAKHLMGMIPIALGGIGDAVGNAAAAYGGKGASGTAERIAAGLEKGEAGRKAQFEEGLKNDPNSQISGHYRNVLAMMMGKKADDPQIRNLSAAQIATTLPEVEKYMAKQLASEQMKINRDQVKASKDLAIGEKESQFKEKMTQGIRQNITGSDAFKNMQKIDYNGRIIEDAMKTPGAYADLATMFSFMKALDPTSVVREGEQERFVATTSVPNRMANTLNSWATGKTLQPEQRQEVAAFTSQMRKNAQNIYKQGAKPSLEQATRLGIKLSEIDPMFTDETPAEAKGAAPTSSIPTVSSQKDYDALPSGTQYKDANGKTYRKK